VCVRGVSVALSDDGVGVALPVAALPVTVKNLNNNKLSGVCKQNAFGGPGHAPVDFKPRT